MVSRNAAKQCRLAIQDHIRVNHVQGKEDNVPRFLIDLRLADDLYIRNAWAVEGNFEQGSDPATDFDVIIGMNVLTVGDFAISNYDGKTLLTFRAPSEERIDFSA